MWNILHSEAMWRAPKEVCELCNMLSKYRLELGIDVDPDRTKPTAMNHTDHRSSELHAPRQQRPTSPLLQAGLPGVERVSNLTPRELVHEYVAKGKPVILTQFAQHWPALGKWTPEFFSTRYGNITREVKGVNYSVSQQMELIKTSTEEKPAPYSYSLNIDKEFPELQADVQPLLLGRSDRLANSLMPRVIRKGTIEHEVFFGGKGAIFPWMHVDLQHLHTQITQLHDDKEFFLFPPSQTAYMYPRKDDPLLSEVSDVFTPDMVRFPMFAFVRGRREMLKEGETIFFPSGWWHMTRLPGPSISYGRALLERSNWPHYLNDTYSGWKRRSPILALPALAMGKVAGAMMSLRERIQP